MTPDAFLDALAAERCSAILRTPIERAAAPAMEAAVEAGFRIVEFTLNTPGALDRIAEFARRPGLIVGAGTVLTAEEARRAVDRGARFLVSPVVDPEVIEVAGDLGVAMMPGCATPTEMLRAYRAGAPLQKLFPAPEEGPAFVRACLGPLPFLRIVPTSGVTSANVAAYLDAGAFAVGFVGPLFDAASLRDGRWDVIETRGRELRRAVAAAGPRA